MARLLIGTTRRLRCGCVSQYGMWTANVLSWARVIACVKHMPGAGGDVL